MEDSKHISKVNHKLPSKTLEKAMVDLGTGDPPSANCPQTDKSDSNNNGEDNKEVKLAQASDNSKRDVSQGNVGLALPLIPSTTKDDDKLLDRIMCGGSHGMFQCMFCGLQFTTADLLEEHETVAHSESSGSDFGRLSGHGNDRSCSPTSSLSIVPSSSIHAEGPMKDRGMISNVGAILPQSYPPAPTAQYSGSVFSPQLEPPAYSSPPLVDVHGQHDHRAQHNANATFACNMCPLVFHSLALHEQHLLEHTGSDVHTYRAESLVFSANLTADAKSWEVDGHTLTQLEPMNKSATHVSDAMVARSVQLQATVTGQGSQVKNKVFYDQNSHPQEPQPPDQNTQIYPGTNGSSSVKNLLGSDSLLSNQHTTRSSNGGKYKQKPMENRKAGRKQKYQDSSPESSWVDDESSGASGHSSLEADSEEKQFKCDVCGKKFKYHASWNVHKRIHTKEKPLLCKVCPKRFGDPANFIRHLKIHVKHGEMYISEDGSYIPIDPNNIPVEPTFEFGMQECFATSFNFNYSCPHCSMGFMMEESLTAHTERCNGFTVTPTPTQSFSGSKGDKKQKKRGRPRKRKLSSSEDEELAPHASNMDVMEIQTQEKDLIPIEPNQSGARRINQTQTLPTPHQGMHNSQPQRRGRGRPRKCSITEQHEKTLHQTTHFNQPTQQNYAHDLPRPTMSHQLTMPDQPTTKTIEQPFAFQSRDVPKQIGNIPQTSQPHQYQPMPSQQRLPLQQIPTPIPPQNQPGFQYQQQAQSQLPKQEQHISPQKNSQFSTSHIHPTSLSSYKTNMVTQALNTNHSTPLPSVGVFSTNIGNIRQRAPAINFSEDSLSCSMCDAIFKNSDALVMHENMHVNNQTVMCKFCGSKFSFLSSMKDHLQNEHGRKIENGAKIRRDKTEEVQAVGQKRRGRPPKQKEITNNTNFAAPELSNPRKTRKRKATPKVELSSEEDSSTLAELGNRDGNNSDDSLSETYPPSFDCSSEDDLPNRPIPDRHGLKKCSTRDSNKRKNLKFKKSATERKRHQVDPVVLSGDLMKECVVTLDDIDSALSGGKLSLKSETPKRKRVPRTVTRNKESHDTKLTSKGKEKDVNNAPKKDAQKTVSSQESDSDEETDAKMRIQIKSSVKQGTLADTKQKSILNFFGKTLSTARTESREDREFRSFEDPDSDPQSSLHSLSTGGELGVPFSCQVCGAQFKMPRLLRKHETSEHPGRPVTSVAQLEDQMKAWCQRKRSHKRKN